MLDKVLECLALLSVLGTVGLFIYKIKSVDIVLIILPILAVIMYVMLTVLPRFPHLLNYPIKVTEENRQALYSLTLRMARWANLLIGLIFANAMLLAIFHQQKLKTILFISLIAGLFFVMWFYILKIFRMQWNETDKKNLKSTTK